MASADGGTPFEAFVRPAEANPELWRFLLGCVIITVFWALSFLVLPAVSFSLLAWIPGEASFTLLVLYLFAGLIAGAALAARLLQRRSFASLIGQHGFQPRLFGLTALGLLALIAADSIFLLHTFPISRNLTLPVWVALLPLGLLGVFLQSSAEEIVFRGYLLQSLAARFQTRVIWLGIPSCLFGLLHWDTATHGPNAWLVAVSAGIAGLILGDVTARFGNLSPAIGPHFANNAAALLFIAPQSPFSGLSLFVLAVDMGDVAAMRDLLLADIVLVLLLHGVWLSVWGRHRRLHSAGPKPI